ncbi:MAG: hypothetical protein CVU46_10535 [Chloroflexi bacterium HGW-Chloroflexi-8]|nr:MAG: hypothetical protein CVU46_10535 [Chloroflexi bacterium HGW-Chloroflexi-8]
MTIITQLQLFNIQDVIPSVSLDLDDWYTCKTHGDFALYHIFSEELIQKIIHENGHVMCPWCLIEKENQEGFRRMNDGC